MSERVDAVVVGSGPNGLAAATVLAGAGLQVVVYEGADEPGGGARTAELTLPGFAHDVCSAVHPMALASPFFRAFDLAAHGVTMLAPEVAFAQPLDGGRAGVVYPDLARTAAGLGADGPAWEGLFAPLVRRWPGLVGAALGDARTVPRDLPAALALGLRVLEQGSPARGRRFRGEVAPALLAGVGAHAIAPLRGPAPAGVALVLTALAHAVGWPVPRGGSGAISGALVAELRRRGVRFVTGHHVRSLRELPPARAVLLDVAPAGLLAMAGDRLPGRYAAALRRFRQGGGACKVDFALRGPVPWRASEVALAGTVHLGGTRAEVDAAEREVAAGRHAQRPFVLAAQPGVVDAGRAPAGAATLWTYAHVPHGSDRDVGDAVEAQVERFAPGFRDLVLHRSVRTAADLAAANPNYVGGDIGAGATTPWQLVARPVARLDPYATPLPGVYLCSASTPPGPGVHGLCGLHAARRALRREFGIARDPLELVAGA